MAAIVPVASAPVTGLLPGSTTTAMQLTQGGLEVWARNSVLREQVTQVGLEAWVRNATLQEWVTQVGLEAWVPGPGGAGFTPPAFFWWIE